MEICFVEWLQEQKGKGFQVFGRFRYADIDPDKLVLALFTSDGGAPKFRCSQIAWMGVTGHTRTGRIPSDGTPACSVSGATT
ncbi:MAG: hypothetical protein VX910_02070 [Candidatus Latescibacterota bacterium]|nr:hypothetical protein [Candidatus Latescibacterota bacterium]